MRPSDPQLEEGLERALAGVGLEAPRILARERSEYATSFPMERLELAFAAGRGGARVYYALRAAVGNGAPGYFGGVPAPPEERFWLFLEWVEGSRLEDVGDV